jgi:hypothetical protein
MLGAVLGILAASSPANLATAGFLLPFLMIIALLLTISTSLRVPYWERTIVAALLGTGGFYLVPSLNAVPGWLRGGATLGDPNAVQLLGWTVSAYMASIAIIDVVQESVSLRQRLAASAGAFIRQGWYRTWSAVRRVAVDLLGRLGGVGRVAIGLIFRVVAFLAILMVRAYRLLRRLFA